MKVLEKMNELIGTSETKQTIMDWAYMNRIMVMSVAEEEEFKELEKTVNKFIEEYDYHGKEDEHKAWSSFLEYEYIT